MDDMGENKNREGNQSLFVTFIAWEKTEEEAKKLFEQLRASEYKTRSCEKRAERLNEENQRRYRPARFMKLFTTSKMGLGISTTGAGKRNTTVDALGKRTGYSRNARVQHTFSHICMDRIQWAIFFAAR